MAPRSRRVSADGSDTFCRIVKGELPAAVVHEDESTMAFLDHRPLFPGHVLLVPRTHVEVLADLPQSDVDRFFRLAQRLEVAVERAAGSDRMAAAIRENLDLAGLDGPDQG